MKLNSKQLRSLEQEESVFDFFSLDKNPLYLILENVYDTYNIGGLFRLADALNVRSLYLCGSMEKPPNHKIEKASIGTYKVVPWTYKNTVVEAIEEIKKNDKNGKELKTVAIEQDERSFNYKDLKPSLPIVLVVGNETFGVLPETLNFVDEIVEIPMWGVNKSLNVIVSASVVCYDVLSKLNK